jgi:hypothetical protein
MHAEAAWHLQAAFYQYLLDEGTEYQYRLRQTLL